MSDTFIVTIIVARVAYRWYRLHRFRGDDRWMAAAAVWIVNSPLYILSDTSKFILLGYFASQIGLNRYGSGLNVSEPSLYLLFYDVWRALAASLHQYIKWKSFWEDQELFLGLLSSPHRRVTNAKSLQMDNIRPEWLELHWQVSREENFPDRD